jgi:hypothetical protein
LVGMPNWDGFASWTKKDAFKNFPIYFTSPYYNDKSDDHSKMLQNNYSKNYKGKPSDMAYKGFELTWLFTKMLSKYPGNLTGHLNEKEFKIFNDYNFQPVYLKKENEKPDYIENKHLYFIRILNGVNTKAW